MEKTATIGIINNFGQTPRQLFKKPHPARSAPIKDPLALGFYPFRPYLQMLMQSVYPLRGMIMILVKGWRRGHVENCTDVFHFITIDIRCEIGDIGVYNDRLGVAACQQSLMIPDGQHYIEWGYSDNSLRLYSTDSKKVRCKAKRKVCTNECHIYLFCRCSSSISLRTSTMVSSARPTSPIQGPW